MSAVTIRNLPEATHRALKLRAAQNGRSTEAEIRSILEGAARPPQRLKMGDELARLGRLLGVDLEIKRDPAIARAAQFR